MTVPQGVSPGQTIQVAAPDGQLISAVVPAGMGPGSSFTMQYPSSMAVVPDATTHVTPVPPPAAAIPVDPITQKPIRAFPVNEKEQEQSNEEEIQEPITATLVEENDEQTSKLVKSSPPATAPTVYPNNPTIPQNAANNQRFLHVQVPPGTPAGSTIHVQIPGENGRMLAAVVPPGVSQFQVAYEPQIPAQTPVVVPSSAVAPPPATTVFPSNSMPQTTYASNYPNTNPICYPPQPSNQRLLLVKVPPGTPPGSRLRVQIPGENRMIEATVPPGVSEFHVAYTPMQANQYNNQSGQAMNRNPNRYGRNQYCNRQNQNNQNRNGQNNQYPYENNNRNNGGLGSMAAPFVVGALTGAAVGSMMHHHSYHDDYDQSYHGSSDYVQNDSYNVDNQDNYVTENNNDYVPDDIDDSNDVGDDYGGGGGGDDYDAGDDYGGGDDGGDFDFGGGDGGGDY